MDKIWPEDQEAMDRAREKIKTEDGEFDNIVPFPPRPIVPRDDCATIEEKDIPRKFIEDLESGDMPIPPQILSINDITISPTLESLFESLLGSILVCQHKPREEMCSQCRTRVEKVDRIRTQMKAEMLTMFDLRRKFSKLQDDNMTLRTYIDTNEPMGTADSIIRQSHMRSI